MYVHVRHWQFWYGVYGFCGKSCNDEVTLYSDEARSSFLGYFELSTQRCLEYSLKYDLDPADDREFCNEIEEFLHGEKTVAYSYIYPRDERDLSRQVPHFAPANDKGHKPVYITMFSKLSEAWDMQEIERSIRIVDGDFLRIGIDKVEFLEIPTYEETKKSYEEN